MRGKKIFISGGAGVIGTALVNQLIEQDADIFVGDLKPCPQKWIGKIRYWQGDLNSITETELNHFEPEIFFHLAATFERSEETLPFLEENFHHNVKLSHHLIKCLKKSSHLKHIIFASSYLIYDPTLYQSTENPSSVTSLKEDSPIYPRNVCGAAKLFHELELRLLDDFLASQMNFISARIFRVYGRGSKDIVSRWIRSALNQEKLQVYRPEGRFDYIFADDVAEGLLRLAQMDYNGVVNLGFGRARSVQEVIDILKKYFPTLQTENISVSIPFEASQANIAKLTQLTNWKPSHDLETGIAKLIDYEKSQLIFHSKDNHENAGVLITSLSKKMPLIEAVRKASAKLGQFKVVFGCDSNSECIGQYGVDHFWQTPPTKEWQIDDLLNFCKQNQIEIVLPTRDGELEFFAKHRDLLKQNHIQVMVSSLETIQNCLDKKRFADLLIQNGFPAIPTFSSLNKIQAPVYVVKKQHGSGSVHLGLRLTKEEAETHARKLEQPIFQPFIEGQEWSIDLFRSFQGQTIGCVTRHRDLIVKGESQITTTHTFSALENLCTKVADFLNIQGHAIFQVIEDKAGEFHIIECNPRFGGASTASIVVGLDSFYWFFLECLGYSLSPQLFQRRVGEIRQIRYPADRIIPWS